MGYVIGMNQALIKIDSLRAKLPTAGLAFFSIKREINRLQVSLLGEMLMRG